jgi:hypothetical protein
MNIFRGCLFAIVENAMTLFEQEVKRFGWCSWLGSCLDLQKGYRNRCNRNTSIHALCAREAKLFLLELPGCRNQATTR